MRPPRDERGPPFRPPVLESRKKTFTSDGGHRVVPPEETLARYGHHVSPITGAVPMLERVAPAGDGVLHVYVAGSNMARPHQDLAHLRGDLRSMNAGKGTSDVQARASGLCEGLERYSGVFRGDEPRRRARLARAGRRGHPAQRLPALQRAAVPRARRPQRRRQSRFSFIPVPFDPEADIDWSPVWSLTRQEVRYLPTAFCYYDYPQPDERTYCIACSNGNAAGNTLEEAILQGFLELVERDSVALWWYNRVRRPGVDLDSFGEPYLGRLRAFLHEHGREFWALDLTADLGIPVFASICRRTDGPPEQIMLGLRGPPRPQVALLRAVTEMNQMLSSPLLEPARQGGRRPGRRPGDGPLARDGDDGEPALPAPRRRAAADRRVVPARLGRRRDGGRPRLPGAGRARGDGDARPGPDAARGRPAGRQGDRAGAAALLGPVRPRPAVRRPGPAGLAPPAARRGGAEPDPHVPVTPRRKDLVRCRCCCRGGKE